VRRVVDMLCWSQSKQRIAKESLRKYVEPRIYNPSKSND